MNNKYYAVERSSDYLEHYGILGMHWGQKKAKSKEELETQKADLEKKVAYYKKEVETHKKSVISYLERDDYMRCKDVAGFLYSSSKKQKKYEKELEKVNSQILDLEEKEKANKESGSIL